MSLPLTLEAFYEAAFLTDAQFTILDCNHRAVEILRATSKDALIGRSITDIPFEHTLAEEFPTYLRERLMAVPFVVIEGRVTRDDQTPFWAETVAHRLSATHHIVTLRDVSARVESFQRAAEANERLRAVLRDRMEFVSNVSHELRTPLTSMSYAITNMLRGICGTLPEKATGYVERLRIDVKRLMTTVNDLLDLRQMENGTLVLHCTTTPIAELLRESANALLIQAEEKHQTLCVDPYPTEVYANIDRHKFERVFFNIFSNAVKYTPENGTICARLYDNDTHISIEVDDTGIGIPAEALPRVSQRYFRIGEHASGTGLGLSIVREITELHHGTFAISSPVPGTTNGTRITITLPKCAPPITTILTESADFGKQLSDLIHPLGHTIQVLSPSHLAVLNSEQAIAMRFIFDGNLPDTTIINAVCDLRRSPAFKQSPILILTDTMEAPIRREYARWRTLVRPRAISAEDLMRLLCD